MPIYEFDCKKCRKGFEELVRNAEEKIECPKCGSKKVSRKMSKFSFKSGGNSGGSASKSGCSSCSSGNCSSCH